jgi:hypothetical protein
VLQQQLHRGQVQVLRSNLHQADGAAPGKHHMTSVSSYIQLFYMRISRQDKTASFKP